MADPKRIEHIKKSPFKLWDIAVYAVSIVLIIGLVIFAFAGKGEEVVITSKNSVLRYPLNENRTLELESGIKIMINGGYVWVESSACPDKTCMHSGKINKPNQIIACVPLSVVIKISGEGKLDAGSGQNRLAWRI